VGTEACLPANVGTEVPTPETWLVPAPGTWLVPAPEAWLVPAPGIWLVPAPAALTPAKDVAGEKPRLPVGEEWRFSNRDSLTMGIATGKSRLLLCGEPAPAADGIISAPGVNTGADSAL